MVPADFEYTMTTSKDNMVLKLESNGSNWVVFKIRLTMSVAAHSTRGHLEGTDACLTKPRLSTDDASKWTPEEQKIFSGYQIQLMKWTQAEDVAHAHITSVVLDSILMRVHSSKTVTIMWKAICDEFENKLHMVSVDLCKRMIELHAKEGDDIHAHLNTLNHMHEQLASMNAMPTLEDYSATILGSLPVPYTQHLFSLTMTAHLNNKPMSPEDIIAYTLELYDLLRLQGNDNSTKNVAFQANAGSAGVKEAEA